MALFAALDNLVAAHSRFQEKADTLNLTLRSYARQVNAAQNLIASNDPAIIMYILGRLQGGQPEAVKNWIDLSTLPQLEASFVDVQSKPEMHNPGRIYVAARTDVANAVEVVKKSLAEANAP